MSTLKPLSDLERAMLAAIGEDPNKHQQNIAARMRGLRPEADKPSKLGNFLLKQTIGIANDKGEPTPAERVAAMKEPESIRWLPDSYVLFRVRASCKCGASHVYPDGPYLCERRVHATQDDPSNPRRYTPMRGIEYPRLPARTQIIFRAISYCESCWHQGPHIIPELTCANEAPSQRAPIGEPLSSQPTDVPPQATASDSPSQATPTENTSKSALAPNAGPTSATQESATSEPSSTGDSSASASESSAPAADSPSPTASAPSAPSSSSSRALALLETFNGWPSQAFASA